MFKLISLDVVSLFTNIPTDFTLVSLSNRWNFISQGTKMNKDEFLNDIKFILNSTFFTFDNQVYNQQTYGTPMGSSLSPILAEICLQDIEIKAIKKLPFDVPLYFRFVDNIILAVPSESYDLVLNTL